MKKKSLIITSLIIIAVIIVTLILKINNIDTTDIEEPTTNYVAIIYHSEMLGIDAVTEYIYYIYPSDEDKYIYIKKQSEITIVGQQEEKRVGSGNLENKEALKRIKKDINNDKKKSAETTISYTYLSNGKTINCSSIDELGDNLFKKKKKV